MDTNTEGPHITSNSIPVCSDWILLVNIFNSITLSKMGELLSPHWMVSAIDIDNLLAECFVITDISGLLEE